jgi:hypothetical protein
MPGPFSRRLPWPADTIIDGWRLRLLPNPQTGRLVTDRPRPLDGTTPDDYDYGAFAPYFVRTFPMRGFLNGAGQSMQEPGKSARYGFAINVDCSFGYPVKGPLFHDATPASTGYVRGFTEGIGHDGKVRLMAITGQYVNELQDTDSFTMEKDFGSGAIIRQAVRFEDPSSAKDSLYFGWTNSSGVVQHFWQWAGATNAWTQGPYPAANFTVLREELWKSWGCYAAKCTSDPMAGTDGGTGVGGNWAAAIQMGDLSSQINWLATNNNMLFVFKENKIYSVDTAPTPNLDKDLFPGLAVTKSFANGVNTAVWANATWVPFGNSFYRMVLGTFGIEDIQSVGPERFVLNNSEVNGPVVASAGHETWFNYIAQYNPINGNSYLGKLGSWIPPEMSGQADAVFANAYHSALKKWAGKQITSMAISTANATQDRLWVGFADGTVQWCKLPRVTPNTTLDPNCEFNLEDGYVSWPLHSGGFESLNKNFKGFGAFGPKLNDSDYTWIEYRVDSAAVFQSTGNFTLTGQRIALPTQLVGKYIDVRAHLTNTSTADTPILEGWALDEQVRPDFVLEHTGVIDGNTPVVLKNSQVSPLSAEQIRDLVRSWVANPGTVPCILPDGTSVDLSFVDYPAETLMNWEQSSGDQYTIAFKAVEFSTLNPITGTYARLESFQLYENLEALEYKEMETF